MDSAVFGLIGAVGGAILAGGGRILQDHLGHRLASRTAARLVYVALDEVETVLGIAVKRGALSEMTRTSLDRALVVWGDNRTDLARILPFEHFDLAAQAFAWTEDANALLHAHSRSERKEFADTTRFNLDWARARCCMALGALEPARLTGVELLHRSINEQRRGPFAPEGDGHIRC